jgi:hypothetical protein
MTESESVGTGAGTGELHRGLSDICSRDQYASALQCSVFGMNSFSVAMSSIAETTVVVAHHGQQKEYW